MVDETKHNKFERLATQRTNKVLRYLRLIGNLSNKSNYEYSQEEVKKMFDAIRKQLKLVESKFNEPEKEKYFSLK